MLELDFTFASSDANLLHIFCSDKRFSCNSGGGRGDFNSMHNFLRLSRYFVDNGNGPSSGLVGIHETSNAYEIDSKMEWMKSRSKAKAFMIVVVDLDSQKVSS